MGYRPTIGAVYNGRLIGVCCFKNYTHGGLLMMAFRLYYENRDCRNAEEYKKRRLELLRRKYPNSHFSEDTASMIDWQEYARYSEFPLIVDFTQRCIYYSESPLPGAELFRRKDSLEMLPTLSRRRYSEGGFIRDFLMESVIWLDKLDLDQIIELSGRAEGFYRYYD